MRIRSSQLVLNFKVSPIVVLFFNLTITRCSTKACKKAKFSLNPFAEVNYLTFFFSYDLKLYKESYKKGKWDLAPSEKIKSVT